MLLKGDDEEDIHRPLVEIKQICVSLFYISHPPSVRHLLKISLGYSPWGHKGLDTTEQLSTYTHPKNKRQSHTHTPKTKDSESRYSEEKILILLNLNSGRDRMTPKGTQYS